VKSDRKRAVILGVLLICGLVFGILSSVSALEKADYLAKLAAMKTQVMIAVFFQAAMATVYVGIAALFYPILKKYNERFAIIYFGFRIIGAAFLFFGIVSLLLLLFLSQRFVSAGQVNVLYFQTIGELLRFGRDLINHVGMILPWSLGGLILCYSMYKIKIVPKWLSLWGIVGAVLTTIVTLMLMLGFIKIVTPVYFIMNAPTALFELSLAIYLIGKGFKPMVVPSCEK
jgi:Domain of unknown function (DUF4386)